MEKKKKRRRKKKKSDRRRQVTAVQSTVLAGWRFLTAPLWLQTPPQPAANSRCATLQLDKHLQWEMLWYPASPRGTQLHPTGISPSLHGAGLSSPAPGISTLSTSLQSWCFLLPSERWWGGGGLFSLGSWVLWGDGKHDGPDLSGKGLSGNNQK